MKHKRNLSTTSVSNKKHQPITFTPTSIDNISLSPSNLSQLLFTPTYSPVSLYSKSTSEEKNLPLSEKAYYVYSSRYVASPAAPTEGPSTEDHKNTPIPVRCITYMSISDMNIDSFLVNDLPFLEHLEVFCCFSVLETRNKHVKFEAVLKKLFDQTPKLKYVDLPPVECRVSLFSHPILKQLKNIPNVLNNVKKSFSTWDLVYMEWGGFSDDYARFLVETQMKTTSEESVKANKMNADIFTLFCSETLLGTTAKPSLFDILIELSTEESNSKSGDQLGDHPPSTRDISPIATFGKDELFDRNVLRHILDFL
jgi:hypothetical protein